MKYTTPLVVVGLFAVTCLTAPAAAAAAEAAPVKTEADFKKMKIKGLKGFLSDRGLSCPDCQEKADFVRFAVANANKKVLAHKVKAPLPEGSFWEVWSNVAKDICVSTAEAKGIAADVAAPTCNAIATGTDSAFMLHGKRTAAKLKKNADALKKTSFGDVYQQAGRRLFAKVATSCLAAPKKCSKASKVEKILEKDNKIKGVEMMKWITNVGVENTNTMYEAIKDKDLNDEL